MDEEIIKLASQGRIGNTSRLLQAICCVLVRLLNHAKQTKKEL